MSSKITVRTVISSPIQKVWQFYTLPEHIVKWNFASNDWECTEVVVDLKVGGNFSSTMAAKDGSFSFDFAGTYTKVEYLKILEYTFGDRTAVIFFEENEGKTTVTVSFDPETTNPEEMQRAGWQAILENFKKYVESAL